MARSKLASNPCPPWQDPTEARGQGSWFDVPRASVLGHRANWKDVENISGGHMESSQPWPE